jgi:hypothetical protein
MRVCISLDDLVVLVRMCIFDANALFDFVVTVLVRMCIFDADVYILV